MRGSFIILFVIVSLLLSISAEGADWKYITKNTEGDMFYINTESIKHISETVVRAWIKTVYKKPKLSDSKELVEALTYEEYDCAEIKFNIIQIINRYSDIFFYPEEDWNDIAPDTIGSAIHNYLCKKGK